MKRNYSKQNSPNLLAQMQTATPEHFDLWLSDAQGHGDSDHGGKFVGWNRSADLAVEAVKAQGQAFQGVPWFAAGHSFGGVLTSLIVAEHPKLFRAAVLLDAEVALGGLDEWPRGFVEDRVTNARWGMQFIWPIKADYRIVWLEPDYSLTLIAREARDYLWIMARKPSVAEEDYQRVVAVAKSLGYDTSLIRKVPQSWP